MLYNKLLSLCKNENTQLVDFWNVVDDIDQIFFYSLISAFGSFVYMQMNYLHCDIIHKGCY